MSRISNRFFVTAIEDGTTLHGNLVATKALSQGWNGSAAIPNWTIASEQPIIYLTLMSGNTEVVPTGEVEWEYNGGTITFDPQTNISTNPSGLFLKTTYQERPGGVEHPALKIISNLANSQNTDVDSIAIKGNYEVSGANIGFSTSTQIRITSIGNSGYFGVIAFFDGISNFTEKDQSITLIAHLYKSDTGEEIQRVGGTSLVIYSVKWYVNGVQQGSTGQSLELFESDIVDNAVIQADFVLGRAQSSSEVICTAFASVDDLTDPEYMYVQYDGQNGTSATLRENQSITYYAWVGRMNDETPIYDYNRFFIKLLNSLGEVITEHIEGWSDADSDGYRQFTPIQSGDNEGKITFSLSYGTVAEYGKNVTGIILAEITEG